MSPTTSCPRCGHPFNNSQGVARFVGCDITDAPTSVVEEEEDDAAIALEEIRRLEGLIHQLEQDRARLFRRVNNRQAATRHLPPEVLSIVFQFARPPIDFDTRSTPSALTKDLHSQRGTCKGDTFQLVLGAVSYHWRQVAWATPQLWTTASVEVYETGSENSVSLLNLYFKNSRSHLMSVELDFRVRLPLVLGTVDSQALKESTLLLESIKTSLLNNAAKIRNFIVTGLPTEWTSLVSEGLLLCESMALYWPSSSTCARRWRNISGSLNLTKLPNLHHFRVTDPYVPFTLPWSTITTLQLSGVLVNQGVELLVKCPNLIEFEGQGLRPENSSPSLNQLVTLKHLESLTWCAYDGAGSSALLRHVRFSKLRVLKWHIRPYNGRFSGEFNRELATFFFSLPETLRVLELDYTQYEYRMMKAVLSSVPHLAELILNAPGSPFFPSSMAVSMIGRPAAGLVEGTVKGRAVVDSNHLDGPKILPCLRKLTFANNFSHLRLEDVVRIVEMLEALHGARVMQEHFSLEMIGVPMKDTVDTWSTEVLARLKQLAKSGFEFEILLGSHRLDYMSCSVDAI